MRYYAIAVSSMNDKHQESEWQRLCSSCRAKNIQFCNRSPAETSGVAFVTAPAEALFSTPAPSRPELALALAELVSESLAVSAMVSS